MRTTLGIAVTLTISCIAILSCTPHAAAAQRSGFIIGFGLGVGNVDFPVGESEQGVAIDFRIGGVLGHTQLYYMNRGVAFGISGADLGLTTLTGLGVTYPLPSNPSLHFNGGLGLSDFTVFQGGRSASDSGVGLVGGVGYEFVRLWMIDFNVTWANHGDGGNIVNAILTLSILSH